MNRYSLFICPECKSKIELQETKLHCNNCDNDFIIRDGVIDFSNLKISEETKRTINRFGELWRIYNHIEIYHREQFFNWITPLNEKDFTGKKVLEAGCGKGRHSMIVSQLNPGEFYAVDLSESIFIARAKVNQKNCIFVRCDLNKLPFSDDYFDLIFSVGVIHHLENPKKGIYELWRVLKNGGKMCLWVYAKEGNKWLLIFVNPIRKWLTSRITPGILKILAYPLILLLYSILKLIYGPLTEWGKKKSFLPYSDYLSSISSFPFREIENIVIDHLSAPVSHYLSRKDIEDIFKELHPAELKLRWHNKNSWTIEAIK